jgi:hypothetical protein
MLFGIKDVLLAGAIGVGLGFAGGYYVHGQLDKASEREGLVEVRRTDAQNVQRSQESQKELDDEIHRITQRSIAHRYAVRDAVAHIRPHRKPARPSTDVAGAGDSVTHEQEAEVVTLADVVLDTGTVRVLSLAATGAVDSAPARSDAEERAPSGVSAQDLVDYTLEVIGHCHVLAARHDMLVDYVEGLQEQQRERLEGW